MTTFNEDFSFDEFAKIPTFAQMRDYCGTRLEFLGRGSSRIAYKLGNSVIKLARNEKGIAQNKAEAECKYQDLPLFAKTFKRAENFEWVLVELCEKVDRGDGWLFYGTLKSAYNDIAMQMLPSAEYQVAFYAWFDYQRMTQALNDFHHSTGIIRPHDTKYFSSPALGKLVGDIVGATDENGKPFSKRFLTNYNEQMVWLIQQTSEWTKKYNPNKLEYADFGNSSNWGLTYREGKKRMVIIDFGLNQEVWDNHYKGRS